MSNARRKLLRGSKRNEVERKGYSKAGKAAGYWFRKMRKEREKNEKTERKG